MIDNKLMAYSKGYDFGFQYPHLKVKDAKRRAPSEFMVQWIKGFKDGKAATGVARF